MNILVIGDIVGKPGRKAVTELVRPLREQYQIDMVIANGENAAGGLGITPEIAEELLGAGVDVLDLRKPYLGTKRDHPLSGQPDAGTAAA